MADKPLITVTTTDRALKVKLAVLKARAANVFDGKALAEQALERTQKRFLRQVDPDQQKWAKLSPLTRKRVSAMGPNHILVDSLALYESIDYRLDTYALKKGVIGASGGGFRIVAGGARAPYARYHQFGEGRVPQRRFLGLSDTDVRALKSTVSQMLKGKAVNI